MDMMDQQELNFEFNSIDELSNGLEYYPHGYPYQNFVMNYSTPYWETIPGIYQPYAENFGQCSDSFPNFSSSDPTYIDL